MPSYLRRGATCKKRGICLVPFEEETVTECWRTIVPEVAPSEQDENRAEAVVDEMTPIQGDSLFGEVPGR